MSTFVTQDIEGSRSYSRARLHRDALNLIHDALEASGMTQVDLAKALGIRKGAVNQVLRGNGNLRLSTLADYLAVLGVQPRIIPTELDFGQSNEVVSEHTQDPFQDFEAGSLKTAQVGTETVFDQHQAIPYLTQNGAGEIRTITRFSFQNEDISTSNAANPVEETHLTAQPRQTVSFGKAPAHEPSN